MAILLPAALAIAAYTINVVYMELARTELQITTDVATRACWENVGRNRVIEAKLLPPQNA